MGHLACDGMLIGIVVEMLVLLPTSSASVRCFSFYIILKIETCLIPFNLIYKPAINFEWKYLVNPYFSKMNMPQSLLHKLIRKY